MAKRKFKVTTVDGSYFLNPINDDELVYNWKLKEDSIIYDLSLTTKLTFIKDDFNFLVQYANDISKRCEIIICEIYKNCGSGDMLEHTGRLSIQSGEWDLDRCTVKISLETESATKDKIDNIKNKTEIPISGVYSNLSAGPYIVETYALVDFDVSDSGYIFVTVGGLHQLHTFIAGPGGGIGPLVGSIGEIVNITSVSGGYFTYFPDGYWRRCGNYNATHAAFGYYLYDYDVSGNPTYIMPRKLNINSLFFNERIDPASDGTQFNLPYMSFGKLCYYIVRELLVNCGRTYNTEHLRSDFFDWNAKGDTTGYIASVIPKLDLTLGTTSYPSSEHADRFIFMPRIPGINYLTGQSNKLTHLMCMPKSNSNNPFVDAWESRVIFSDDGSGGFIVNTNSNKLTFEDIEHIWATVFNAFWFIDTDGCMRVEHISWFNNNSHLYDSTNTLNKHLNIANRKFKFNKDKLAEYEVFKFSVNRDRLNGNVDTGFDNLNNEIFYDSICASRKGEKTKKEYVVTQVNTDITGINSANNSAIAEYYDVKGIFLCTVDFNSPTNIVANGTNPYNQGVTIANSQSEALLNTTDIITYENGHLQWANLIRRYLLDRRILSVGKNGLELINFSVKTIKTKEQENVKLIQCCGDETFNPTQAIIRTELGDGIIEEAEYNTKTNIIKIKALHD